MSNYNQIRLHSLHEPRSMFLIYLPVVAAFITLPQQVTKIVNTKSTHTMVLYHDKSELWSFKVSLGSNSGKKQFAGDHKTPEGVYRVDGKKEVSKFHRALHISYPTPKDTAQAKMFGKDAGGDIEIHGQIDALNWLGLMARHIDWTAGCIALTNEEIDSIWSSVSIGTPVEIIP